MKTIIIRMGLIAGLFALFGAGPVQAQYTNLHEFGGGTGDGMYPLGTLTLSGTTLYGMTEQGGASDRGVIFQMNADGSGYANLHEFADGAGNGVYPFGLLTLSGTTLYGMTIYGGARNLGVVFKISTNGSGYANLHEFVGGAGDGRWPSGSLTLSGTTLYGMTQKGGVSGNGVIFKISTNGSGYANLHEFVGGAGDGMMPYGSLTLSGTTLYGMTESGGASGNGVIFKVNTDGSGYANLHVFAGGAGDGRWPIGSLTLSGTTLYGMTQNGGVSNNGVVFMMNADGSGYTKLHEFAGGAGDGAFPYGTLTLSGTMLYGMTDQGGASNKGVVFALSLAKKVSVLLQQGAGGIAGVWGLGTNYQPSTWTQITGPLGGSWALRGMNQQRILLQQGTGGIIGLWDTINNLPDYWWKVSDPLAGWIARDVDGNRILLQAGDGGMVGLWTLSSSNTPATWAQLSVPTPGLIALALTGNRVLVQFGASTPIGYWTLDGGNNVTAWTQLNAALPAGWILRDMTPNYILLQQGDGGMAGLWGLDTNGIPNAWHPVTGTMPGWIMRAIEEQ